MNTVTLEDIDGNSNATLADLANVPEEPDTEPEPPKEDKKSQIIQKSKTRKIRPTIFEWFDTMTPDQIRAITLQEFKDKVLSVDPGWPIAVDEKRVKIHLSWYRGNYKKNHAKPSAAPAAPTA